MMTNRPRVNNIKTERALFSFFLKNQFIKVNNITGITAPTQPICRNIAIIDFAFISETSDKR